MILLIDTHLLLWAAGTPERLPEKARGMIADPCNELLFSAVSIWEIAIKAGLGREDFQVDARRFWRLLQAHGYRELLLTSEHAVGVMSLPPLHKDPFDRMLVVQARSEGISLLTADTRVAVYGEDIVVV